MILIQFHEVLVIGHVVNVMDLNQFKAYNSCTTRASLIEHHVHKRLIVINIYFMFHEIWFRGYLVMANFVDLKSKHLNVEKNKINSRFECMTI